MGIKFFKFALIQASLLLVGLAQPAPAASQGLPVQKVQQVRPVISLVRSEVGVRQRCPGSAAKPKAVKAAKLPRMLVKLANDKSGQTLALSVSKSRLRLVRYQWLVGTRRLRTALAQVAVPNSTSAIAVKLTTTDSSGCKYVDSGVVNVAYSLLENPTATASPTPSSTVTPTPTQRAIPTSTPTALPVPSNTPTPMPTPTRRDTPTPRPILPMGTTILSTESDALTAYWPCDDERGATAITDASGHAHDLIAIPGGSLPNLQQAGLHGPAVSGGLNRGAYINTNLTGLSSSGVYWYNRLPATGFTLWGLFKNTSHNYWSNRTGSVPTIVQVSDSLSATNWNGFLGDFRAGANYSTLDLNGRVDASAWHTYAIVMDPSLGHDGISVYIDNNRIGSYNAYAGAAWSPDFLFLLGNQNGGFNGSVQHVATWNIPLDNHALTALQAAARTVADTSPPLKGLATVSVDGTRVNLTVTDNASYPLQIGTIPAGLAVTADGAPVSIEDIEVDPSNESNVIITLHAPIRAWQMVELSYSGTGINDNVGNVLAAFSNLYVDNYSEVTNPQIPTVVSHGWVIPQTSDGWTNLDVLWAHAHRNGARKIFVATNGSDQNNGLTMQTAVRTVAHALQIAGAGDWVLLRSGDTWNEGASVLNGGTSPHLLGLLGSYSDGSSTARPVLTQPITNRTNYVVIYGIKVDLSWRQNEDVEGYSSLDRYRYHLMEDLWLDNAHDGTNIQGPSHVYIHRINVTNSHSDSAHAQGIYMSGVAYLTIDDCFLDHNGWSTAGSKTIFNHNVYLQYDNLAGYADFTNNISARASSHGLQNRGGGVVENNLFLQNPIAGFIGLTGNMRNNVVFGSDVIGPGFAGGFGLLLNGVAASPRFPYIEMSGNAVVHNDSTYTYGTALEVADLSASDPHLAGLDTSVQDIRVHDNVVSDWKGSAFELDRANGFGLFTNLEVYQNLFDQHAVNSGGYLSNTVFPGNYRRQSWHHNSYVRDRSADNPFVVGLVGANTSWSTWSQAYTETGSTFTSTAPNFADPGRTIDTYMASIGLPGGEAEFLATRAAMGRYQNWDPRFSAAAVNAYLRAGFQTR